MAKKIKKHHNTLKLSLVAIVIGCISFTGSTQYFVSHPLCANTNTCESDLSEQIDNDMIGIFQGRAVLPPKINLAQEILQPTRSVLGEKIPQEEKHIYVDLATQTLYAYEGNTQVLKTLISSGKWGRTPVGNFHIWMKLRATRMSGGSGADAYNLPNVPYVMYFYRDFGLHGAYWHNNFGHEMSHGCVNMRIVDANTVYDWTDGPTTGRLGTAVSVCSAFTAPNVCIQENPIR